MIKLLPKITAGLMIMLLVMVFMAQMGWAAELPSVGSINIGSSGLRSGSLPEFVGTIIRWVLGLIGVALVALFVYGGVLYATSAGNEDKVETGKKVMIYAIIGTIIIVAAFLVSDYVISALLSGGEQAAP